MIPSVPRTLAPLSCIALLAVAGSAQSIYPLAYPQATTSEGSGNIIPLGAVTGSTNFDETRYQLLIPPTHLPTTPAAIVGVEVISNHSTTTVLYANLEVTLSNTPSTVLSTTFDANLLAPTVAFSGTNASVTFNVNQWSPILFTTPFLHNGGEGLVIDIKKAIDRNTYTIPGVVTMETLGTIRSDLPVARTANGPLGSGAMNSINATGTHSQFMKVRLLVVDVPTVDLLSDVGGRNGNVFALGASASVRLHSVSGSPFLVFAETVFTPPIAIPPFQGALIVPPLTILFSGTTNAAHEGVFSAAIPNLNVLIGGHITFQGVALQNGSLYFTNGADAFVNS
ncbi:MAG: hypothetical protein JNM84_01350 [Planctomycetes bacterium]|nr:hypothetical protein [Planctomycetota bacterium]